MNIYRSHLLIC